LITPSLWPSMNKKKGRKECKNARDRTTGSYERSLKERKKVGDGRFQKRIRASLNFPEPDLLRGRRGERKSGTFEDWIPKKGIEEIPTSLRDTDGSQGEKR